MIGRAVRVPKKKNNNYFRGNPTVADLQRGKTCQSALYVAEHSLGQIVAYLTVCEILAPMRAQAQMVCSGVSVAVFAGVGLQR